MSNSQALVYLPSLRRGLARSIPDADPLKGPLPAAATLSPWVQVAGEKIQQSVKLRGPGHVTGLDPQAIRREVPRAGTTDFEPNLLPYIEFSAPELPWLFTPAAPGAKGQLRPWLVLIVVRRQEGVTFRRDGQGPLPTLTLSSPARLSAELPDLADSAAWAHVQSRVPIDQLEAAVVGNSAEVISRLICPRHLEDRASYLACLVPAFDVGVKAGLGEDPSSLTEASPAWDVKTLDTEGGSLTLPVYYSWSFRTGAAGDFEALCRRLKPDDSKGDVGAVPLDVTRPSDLLTAWTGKEPILQDFTGPLLSPGTTARAWDPTHQRWFQSQTRTLLDATAQRATVPQVPDAKYDPATDDPVVGPPLYGAWQANRFTVPPDDPKGKLSEDSWMRELNLNPALRATAGLGAQVVQKNQEALMASAWKQAEEAREANRALNQGRLAAEAGRSLARRVGKLEDAAALQLTRPLHTFVQVGNQSLAQNLRLSPVPNGLISPAFSRLARPGSTVARQFKRQSGGATLNTSLTTRFVSATRSNASEVEVKTLQYARYTRPAGTQVSDPTLEKEVKVEGTVLSSSSAKTSTTKTRPTAASTAQKTVVTSATPKVVATAPKGTTNSVKTTAKSVSSTSVSKDVSSAATHVRAALDPLPAIRARLLSRMPALVTLWKEQGVAGAELPTRLRIQPKFVDPLFWELRALGTEFVLPGAGTVPNNRVRVLKVDNRFVAAFLAGANHEMSRELLWREFPTDLGNTFFHRFWDTGEEGGADISDIHRWSDKGLAAQVTGTTADAENVSVVLIRGDLIRRYPTVQIYLVKAGWATDGGSSRTPDLNTALDPIFSGALDEGTLVLGFNKGLKALKGDKNGAKTAENAGYFVVIEEAPTEARFGLDAAAKDGSDLTRGATSWDGLTWGHLAAKADETVDFIVANKTLPGRTKASLSNVTWGYNAAHMARILFQKPFRLLVHADELL